MRAIALEEHYATEVFMEGPGRQLKEQAEAARSHPQVAAGYEKLIEELCDLGDGRIAAMDAAGIDAQTQNSVKAKFAEYSFCEVG